MSGRAIARGAKQANPTASSSNKSLGSAGGSATLLDVDDDDNADVLDVSDDAVGVAAAAAAVVNTSSTSQISSSLNNSGAGAGAGGGPVSPAGSPGAREPPPERSAFDSDKAYRLAQAVYALGLELKCPVCMSLFNNPSMLPCGHTYCNLCARNWLAASPTCPGCRQKGVKVRSLRPDDTMRQLVRFYRQLQPKAVLQGHVAAAGGAGAAGITASAVPLFTQLPGLTQIYNGFKAEGEEEEEGEEDGDGHGTEPEVDDDDNNNEQGSSQPAAVEAQRAGQVPAAAASRSAAAANISSSSSSSFEDGQPMAPSSSYADSRPGSAGSVNSNSSASIGAVVGGGGGALPLAQMVLTVPAAPSATAAAAPLTLNSPPDQPASSAIASSGGSVRLSNSNAVAAAAAPSSSSAAGARVSFKEPSQQMPSDSPFISLTEPPLASSSNFSGFGRRLAALSNQQRQSQGLSAAAAAGDDGGGGREWGGSASMARSGSSSSSSSSSSSPSENDANGAAGPLNTSTSSAYSSSALVRESGVGADIRGITSTQAAAAAMILSLQRPGATATAADDDISDEADVSSSQMREMSQQLTQQEEDGEEEEEDDDEVGPAPVSSRLPVTSLEHSQYVGATQLDSQVTSGSCGGLRRGNFVGLNNSNVPAIAAASVAVPLALPPSPPPGSSGGGSADSSDSGISSAMSTRRPPASFPGNGNGSSGSGGSAEPDSSRCDGGGATQPGTPEEDDLDAPEDDVIAESEAPAATAGKHAASSSCSAAPNHDMSTSPVGLPGAASSAASGGRVPSPTTALAVSPSHQQPSTAPVLSASKSRPSSALKARSSSSSAAVAAGIDSPPASQASQRGQTSPQLALQQQLNQQPRLPASAAASASKQARYCASGSSYISASAAIAAAPELSEWQLGESEAMTMLMGGPLQDEEDADHASKSGDATASGVNGAVVRTTIKDSFEFTGSSVNAGAAGVSSAAAPTRTDTAGATAASSSSSSALPRRAPSYSSACCVMCGGRDSEEGNLIVICGGSGGCGGIAVHQTCYGIDDESEALQKPEGEWMCAWCAVNSIRKTGSKGESRGPNCLLCPIAGCEADLKPDVRKALITAAAAVGGNGSSTSFSSKSEAGGGGSERRSGRAQKLTPKAAASALSVSSPSDGTAVTPACTGGVSGNSTGLTAALRAALLPSSSDSASSAAATAWRPCLSSGPTDVSSSSTGTGWVHALCATWAVEPFTQSAGDLQGMLQASLASGKGSASSSSSSSSKSGASSSGKKGRGSKRPSSSSSSDDDVVIDTTGLGASALALVNAVSSGGLRALRQPLPIASADDVSIATEQADAIMSQLPVAALLPLVDCGGSGLTPTSADVAAAASRLPPAATSPALLRAALAWLGRWSADTLLVVNVATVDKSRWGMMCDACGLAGRGVGACTQCAEGACLTAYHPMCAVLGSQRGLPALKGRASSSSASAALTASSYLSAPAAGMSSASTFLKVRNSNSYSNSSGSPTAAAAAAGGDDSSLVEYHLYCASHAGPARSRHQAKHSGKRASAAAAGGGAAPSPAPSSSVAAAGPVARPALQGIMATSSRAGNVPAAATTSFSSAAAAAAAAGGGKAGKKRRSSGVTFADAPTIIKYNNNGHHDGEEAAGAAAAAEPSGPFTDSDAALFIDGPSSSSSSASAGEPAPTEPAAAEWDGVVLSMQDDGDRVRSWGDRAFEASDSIAWGAVQEDDDEDEDEGNEEEVCDNGARPCLPSTMVTLTPGIGLTPLVVREEEEEDGGKKKKKGKGPSSSSSGFVYATPAVAAGPAARRQPIATVTPASVAASSSSSSSSSCSLALSAVGHGVIGRNSLLNLKPPTASAGASVTPAVGSKRSASTSLGSSSKAPAAAAADVDAVAADYEDNEEEMDGLHAGLLSTGGLLKRAYGRRGSSNNAASGGSAKDGSRRLSTASTLTSVTASGGGASNGGTPWSAVSAGGISVAPAASPVPFTTNAATPIATSSAAVSGFKRRRIMDEWDTQNSLIGGGAVSGSGSATSTVVALMSVADDGSSAAARPARKGKSKGTATAAASAVTALGTASAANAGNANPAPVVPGCSDSEVMDVGSQQVNHLPQQVAKQPIASKQASSSSSAAAAGSKATKSQPPPSAGAPVAAPASPPPVTDPSDGSDFITIALADCGRAEAAKLQSVSEAVAALGGRVKVISDATHLSHCIGGAGGSTMGGVGSGSASSSVLSPSSCYTSQRPSIVVVQASRARLPLNDLVATAMTSGLAGDLSPLGGPGAAVNADVGGDEDDDGVIGSLVKKQQQQAAGGACGGGKRKRAAGSSSSSSSSPAVDTPSFTGTLNALLARRRSHRYLTALMSGALIVSTEWLDACVKAGALVHEAPYRLCGDKGLTSSGAQAAMLYGPSPLVTLTAGAAAAAAASADGAAPARKRSRGSSGGGSSSSSSSASAASSSLSYDPLHLRSSAPARARAAVAAAMAHAASRSGSKGNSGSILPSPSPHLLLSGLTFVLWGEFECPPKNTTSGQVAELTALGGANGPVRSIDRLGEVPASVTAGALATAASSPPSSSNSSAFLLFDSDDGDNASPQQLWADAVKQAMGGCGQMAAISSTDGSDPLSLIVICDEPAWSPAPCVTTLASARPGSVAMVTPEWLLDCCSCYSLLDPAAEGYRHPGWKVL